MKRIALLFGLCLACAIAHGQKFEQLALTPPMGWNSWNKFGCNVNEELVRQIADAMVSSGMKDAGYEYVVIDDCWHGQRDNLGFIHPDPKLFPSGIKALADYVHSKGLKFGIYSCAGDKTCAGRPGSRGHEYQDALTYAQWGVDYLKYDWCNTEGLNAEGAYMTMRDALYAAGRPIVFSICEWGSNKPWLWAPRIGHLWRTTGDIVPRFDTADARGRWRSWGVLQIIDRQVDLRQYAGPGHWNDPDMLEVGNGMSVNEDRAHFSMWCMLAAPLMAGNDLRNMSAETLQILTNRDVIAIDQDPLGVQGFRYSAKDGLEVWFKPLANDEWAMCVLNRSNVTKQIVFDWKNENVYDNLIRRGPQFDKVQYSIRDLWVKKDLGTTATQLVADVPGHDVLMLRLSKPKPVATAAAPDPHPAQRIIRINAGADAAYTDPDGNLWLPDQGFADGDTVSRPDSLEILNTKNPVIYRTERYGMTQFDWPLPNGRYLVKLHFAETYDGIGGPGDRVFSFSVEGTEFKDFDVFVKAGGFQRAYVETVPVQITDGKLDITFSFNNQNPEINAIEIIPQLD